MPVISPEDLRSLLKVCREEGVSELTSGDLRVVLGPDPKLLMQREPDEMTDEEREEEEDRLLFRNVIAGKQRA